MSDDSEYSESARNGAGAPPSDVEESQESAPPSSQDSRPFVGIKPSFRKRKGGNSNEAPQSKQPRIGRNKRVRMTRRNLFQRCNETQAPYLHTHLPNDHLYYGTVISGGGGGSKTSSSKWNVKFDVLPFENNVVKHIERKLLHVLSAGEDEPASDPAHLCDDIADAINKRKQNKSPWSISVDEFLDQPKEALATATQFEAKWGEEQEQRQIWMILKDEEYITDSNFKLPEKAKLKLDRNASLYELFFDSFFPSVQGHAALLDKYLSDSRADYHTTYKNRKFKFHDEQDDDPDWKVKQCYLLIIAAASEFHTGVENLWKKGKGPGRMEYPDFGKYFDKDMFQCFKSAAVYCFADQKYWYKDDRDITWAMFQPVIDGYNDRRKDLFVEVCMAVFDETMIGWRPKTTKEGGLPNITFEPRKPIELGTMIRNSAECTSGVTRAHEVVENSCKMSEKDYVGIPSSFYGGLVPSHTSVVLRLAEKSGVPSGGWVGGDAWFGSVASCVELHKRFGVHSSFIVKNNDHWFPRKILLEILLARHGRRVAGHWTTMKTTIEGVPIIAMAYAWSQKGVSFFVSTCGTTVPSVHAYVANFQDEWGRPSSKELPRPMLAEFLYDYLPIIDEWNRSHQKLLNIQGKWPTHNPWVKLIIAISEFSAADMHRGVIHEEFTQYSSLNIVELADTLSASLRLCERSQSLPSSRLVRITGGKNDSPHKELTASQMRKGKNYGRSVELSCWMCRKYTDRLCFTQWECSECGTALCRQDRTGEEGRTMSCQKEHFESTIQELRCDGRKKPTVFPNWLKIKHHEVMPATLPPPPPSFYPVPSPSPFAYQHYPPLPGTPHAFYPNPAPSYWVGYPADLYHHHYHDPMVYYHATDRSRRDSPQGEIIQQDMARRSSSITPPPPCRLPENGHDENGSSNSDY